MATQHFRAWRWLALAAWVAAAASHGEEAPAPPQPTPEAAEGKYTRELRELRERLRVGKLLFSDDFDREELGADWVPEEGAWRTAHSAKANTDGVIGTNGAKYPDSFLWTKQSFKGDVAIECEVEPLGESPRDANLAICGKAPNYPPPEKPLYLFVLGGFENTRSGVERAPDYKWKFMTGRFTLAPRKTYRLLAARLGSKFYLFVDDELIVEARDPSPLPAEGQIAFHVYQSSARFGKLRVREAGK